jgi:hypothetical protein
MKQVPGEVVLVVAPLAALLAALLAVLQVALQVALQGVGVPVVLMEEIRGEDGQHRTRPLHQLLLLQQAEVEAVGRRSLVQTGVVIVVMVVLASHNLRSRSGIRVGEP